MHYFSSNISSVFGLFYYIITVVLCKNVYKIGGFVYKWFCVQMFKRSVVLINIMKVLFRAFVFLTLPDLTRLVID